MFPFVCIYILFFLLLLYLLRHAVTEEQLRVVAENSNILSAPRNYLPDDFTQQCAAIIENPSEIEPQDYSDAYLYLRESYLAAYSVNTERSNYSPSRQTVE